MDRKTERCAMGAEEIEAPARIDDKDARPVHRERMEQHAVHGRGLPRARGSHDQHVGVLLAVLPVQGIEGHGLACPVVEDHARTAGADGAP